MAATGEDTAGLRQLIDAARAERGWSLQQLAARSGFGSAQAVQQKLAGKVRWQPGEVIEVAEAVGIDPLLALGRLWPAIAEHDPLHRLRSIMAGAPASEVEALERIAERLAEQRAVAAADELSRRRGRRRSPGQR